MTTVALAFWIVTDFGTYILYKYRIVYIVYCVLKRYCTWILTKTSTAPVNDALTQI